MQYDIKLVNCGNNKVVAIKKLREILGCDLSSAKQYAENTPCVLVTDADEYAAREIIKNFQSAGIEVDLIEKKQGFASYTPDLPPSTTSINNSGSNEREILIDIWHNYHEYNKALQNANEQITKNENRISSLKKEAEKIQKDIDLNKRIKATNGECLRPPKKRYSLIELPDFSMIKTLFIAITIVSFVILLILLAIFKAPFNEAIDKIQKVVHINEGLLFFLAAPCIAVIISIIFILGYMIKCAFDTHSMNRANAWRHKNFDTATAVRKATEFMNNIDSYMAEKNNKEKDIVSLEEENKNIKIAKQQLPAVPNTIPMPPELRSEEGVLLLLQYIDTGRAYTLQQAINLYYQDMKDAKRMAELQKQTEYAKQQLVNSQIAAENSRIAAANSQKTYEAAQRSAAASERAADAAEESAHWDFLNYLNNNK